MESKQDPNDSANNETNHQNPAVYTTGAALCPPDYNSYSAYYGYPGQTGAPMSVAYPANGSNVIVVTPQQQPPTQYVAVKQSFACHYFWSCLVFWLCGFVFGGIAFIFAALGSSRASSGDSAGARTMGGVSIAFNVIGFIAGCVAWGFLIWWLVVYVIYTECWSFNGVCYAFRNCHVNSASQCYTYYPGGYYYGGCCYYY